MKTLFDNVSEDEINTQLKIIEDQIESTQQDSFMGLLQRQQMMINLEQISAIKQLKNSFNPLPDVDQLLNLIHSPRKESTLFNMPFDQVLAEF